MTLDNRPDLNGYELLERIGSGGSGAVYRARQTSINREVAVKIIQAGLANKPEFVRRFEMEAQLIARLEHPHITPLIDYWRNPEGAYLVMRYLRGGSVRNVLDIGAYELPAASQLLDQIASALEFAHRQHVIHRDIKPGNILLDEDGNAYLADFGIAKDLTSVPSGLTVENTVMGSLDYVSPEQARGEPVTSRTDIYSLGVVLYELITGEHPFKEFTALQRLYRHINDPLPLIDGLDADKQDEINAIIQQATAKDPRQRYPDVLALAVAFREAVGRDDTAQSQQVIESLTLREHEILQLVAERKSNREIAAELFITVGTVRWYIRQIYKKLGVGGRVQAIVRARELDLIITGDRDDETTLEKSPVHSVSFPEPKNPFKGLLPFQTSDALDFFGREELVDRLIGRLQETDSFRRFLAVVGPSGSGKSSLVKAGLIPAIWKGRIPGSERWYVVEMIPGARPIDKLETALIRVAANPVADLHEQLMRDAHGLERIADIILPSDGTELLIVIDQFEEVFVLVEDESIRVHFLELIHAAVTDPRSRVRIVVTLRADHYDKPLHYALIGELLRSRLETILPLGAKALERAIRQPVMRMGVTYEPGLVEQIVSEMTYQSGALPLLQYALTELFNHREGRLVTHAVYQRIGGSVGALAKRAGDVFNSLTPDAQELTRQLFLRLVTLGEGAEDTRRRATLSELVSLTPNGDLTEEIVDQFVDVRLLSLDHDPETRQPTVEVAHEALLREWERLRQWLNDSRDDIRQERQLEQAANDWDANQEDTSYLLRGTRLEQVDAWQNSTELILTPLEKTFISKSIDQHQVETRVETERQAREQAQERHSRNLLRMLVVVFALAAILSGGFGVFALGQKNEAVRSAEQSHSLALAARAPGIYASGNQELALALAVEAVKMDNPPPESVSALLNIGLASGTIHAMHHTMPAWSVAFSPDGRYLASSSGPLPPVYREYPTVGEMAQEYEVADDSTIRLWDVQTGTEVRRFSGHHDTVYSIAFSPDGQHLISSAVDGELILWDVATGDILRRFDVHQGARTTQSLDGIVMEAADATKGQEVAYSPDGRLVASTGADGYIVIIDVDPTSPTFGSEIWRLDADYSTFAVDFHPNGHWIIVGSNDGLVTIWDIATGEKIKTFETHSAVTEVKFNPDGSQAISSSVLPPYEEFLWDTNPVSPTFGTALKQWSNGLCDCGGEYNVAFTADGQTVFAGTFADAIVQYNLATDEVSRVFTDERAPVWGVALSPDGHTLASAAWDGTVRLRDISNPTEFAPSSEFPLIDFAVSPDGATLYLRYATEGYDSLVQFYDLASHSVLREFNVTRPVVSHDWTKLFDRNIISADNPSYTVKVFDIQSGDLLETFNLAADFGVPQDYTSSDYRTVTGNNTVEFSLVDLATGENVDLAKPVDTNSGTSLNQAVFSPDETLISLFYDSGTVILRSAVTGDLIRQIDLSSTGQGFDKMSPDSQTLLSTNGSTMQLWDIKTGKVIHEFVGHDQWIIWIAYSPDGRKAISAGQDGRTIVWNLQTGEQILSYELGSKNPVSVAALSPDGSTAYSLVFPPDGSSTILHQWPTNLADILAWVQANRYVRPFKDTECLQYRIDPSCGTQNN